MLITTTSLVGLARRVVIAQLAPTVPSVRVAIVIVTDVAVRDR
jgi:hypothetical protein